MDKSGLFRIGDVANLFHLSVGTLRHYEKTGLLHPEYIDPDTGYRYYSTRQFECLNTIRYLRVLDTPLDQIADFLENRDVDRICELLRQQKETVISKQNALKNIEKKIENRLSQIQDALSSDLDTVRIAEVPARKITWIRSTLSIASYLDLELSIQELVHHQKDALVFLGKIGVGIAKEQLLKEKYDQYDMVFLLLEPEDSYEGEIYELPPETCVTLRFRGSHQEAPAYYQKLASFIAEHQLQITGFSKEITLIDYGLTNDTDKFVTEIQIPVSNSRLRKR